MSSNFISSLEVCGEKSVFYTPEWTSADPKLVALDTENSEEDARIMHNLEVLERLSMKYEEELLMDTDDPEEAKESVVNFVKDIEIFENSFRFSPTSKLFREDTGETIYITGDQNDPVRFLFYAKPEAMQPEVPMKGEDILNMKRPISATEIDKIEMIMQRPYSHVPFSSQVISRRFPEINLVLDITRTGFPSDHPYGFVVPEILGNTLKSSSKELHLTPTDLYWEDSTSVFGYSPEGEFYGSKAGYHKIMERIGTLTKEEGGLKPSDFFIKVEEKKEEDYLKGSVKLRISL